MKTYRLLPADRRDWEKKKNTKPEETLQDFVPDFTHYSSLGPVYTRLHWLGTEWQVGTKIH